MEKDINFTFQDIYSNIDDKNEKQTKKLLNDSLSTTDKVDPFCCSYFFKCLFGCCFLLFK